ncbi:predicted protein [Nematostella vectensis]|uniref:Ubiquitin-like protein ATG12 n=1 Tax=Nematostella vectensis TaxID=45351 RepID=A7RKL8_NEMVE|nr:ubiquitin-like protein ATG12 [Nematostella vectensis]EDO48009.1 predicted protein [Nematostella vectensis]|eukprot:XP_001640072.1 predicted protein [Nematostella vectensis]
MADEGQASETNTTSTNCDTNRQPVATDASQTENPTNIKQSAKDKVEVLLKAAGDAPIMKRKKWAVEGSKTVAYLIEFIRKYIRCEPSESLFLYVGQAFAPSPDQLVSNLYNCFGADGKLVLHYCKSQAWG